MTKAEPVVLEMAMIREIEEMVPESDRKAFLGEIFGLFITTAPVALSQLHQALAGGDIKALESNAHRLKGSCLSIGAQALAERCEALESLGRQGVIPADGASQLALMEQLYGATKAELDRKLASLVG